MQDPKAEVAIAERFTLSNELADAVAIAARKAGLAARTDPSVDASRAGWIIQKPGADSSYGVLVLASPNGIVQLWRTSDSGGTEGEVVEVPALSYDLVSKDHPTAVANVLAELQRLIATT